MRTGVALTLLSLALGVGMLAACTATNEAPQNEAAPDDIAQDDSAHDNTPAAGNAEAASVSSPEASTVGPQESGSAGPTLEGTQWLLLQLGDEEVVPEGPQGEPSLMLDPEGSRASGTGGCNQFTGTYTLDATSAALAFGPLAATRMMCPEGMDTEAAFLDAMGRVRSYGLLDVDGHLELYDGDGALIARFEARS